MNPIDPDNPLHVIEDYANSVTIATGQVQDSVIIDSNDDGPHFLMRVRMKGNHSTLGRNIFVKQHK